MTRDSGFPQQFRITALKAHIGECGLELTTPLYLPKVVVKETLFIHVAGSAVPTQLPRAHLASQGPLGEITCDRCQSEPQTQEAGPGTPHNKEIIECFCCRIPPNGAEPRRLPIICKANQGS